MADIKIQVTKVCTIILNNEAEISALLDILDSLDTDEIKATSEQLHEELLRDIRKMLK